MYRASSKPIIERIVPKRKTYDFNYPADLEARSTAWGIKTRIIHGGSIAFGLTTRHDRLNWFIITAYFLFWTISVRVINPAYSSRTGHATYGD